MYTELLKQLYFKERKILEAMWIFKKESKIRLLQKRKSIMERVQGNLSISELLGRSDIAEETKDDLLRDGRNEDRVKEHIEKNIEDELSEIENEEKEELKNKNYSPDEYADYLFQLEKVFALEDAISEERLFPEAVYEEQKVINEKGTV
jgi:hypothetical protein